MTTWFFILGLALFACGTRRSLRGACHEPTSFTTRGLYEARNQANRLLMQGILIMVVGGFVAGSLFGELIK